MIIIEKSTFNKSKIKKNGKLMIVFHGSNVDFDVFEKNKIGSHTDSGMWGKGFYFTNFEATAKAYGKFVKRYYINIENPFIINDFKTKEDVANYLNISEDILSENSAGLIRPMINFVGQFTSEVKYKGHDGIIVSRNPTIEYVVFDPDQVKLVDS